MVSSLLEIFWETKLHMQFKYLNIMSVLSVQQPLFEITYVLVVLKRHILLHILPPDITIDQGP